MFAAMLLAMANPADYGLGTEWQPVADLRGEIMSGRYECDTPDHVAKTCEGIGIYRIADDGTITAIAMIPINNKPQLDIVIPAPVRIENDMVCGRFEKADFDRMFLLAGAKKLETPAGQKLLVTFRDGMAEELAGKELCTLYFANGERRHTVALLDGVYAPDFSGESAWIAPDANYELRTTEPLVKK